MDVFRLGLTKGLAGYLWLLKILVPISFITMLLVHSGWIHRMDIILNPVMGLLGLPAMAALPLIVSLLTGIYGDIAAMAPLSLSVTQATLMTVFILIAHNLPQESAVQAKSGLSFVKATAVRLGAAVITVALMAQILQPETAPSLMVSQTAVIQLSISKALGVWAMDTLALCAKICLILTPLMVVLEVLKQYHVIENIVRPMGPLLALLGLERRMGLLWLTAALFGLAYGSAVIVEETSEGNFSATELERLQASIGINHAVIEDPVLFLPFGVHPFWLWIPRLTAAIVAVHMIKILQKLRPEKDSEPAAQ